MLSSIAGRQTLQRCCPKPRLILKAELVYSVGRPRRLATDVLDKVWVERYHPPTALSPPFADAGSRVFIPQNTNSSGDGRGLNVRPNLASPLFPTRGISRMLWGYPSPDREDGLQNYAFTIPFRFQTNTSYHHSGLLLGAEILESLNRHPSSPYPMLVVRRE